MKRFFTRAQFCMVALAATLASSCKQEKLGDVLTKEAYPAVSISLDTKMEVKTGSKYTLNGADMVLPVTLNFSGPTSRAFTIKTSIDVESVPALIAAGTLPQGTVPVSASAATVATTANVPIGVTSFAFNVNVSRSFMEINFGKTIALVVKVANPDKGNIITTGKSSTIVAINTSAIIDPTAIHEVAFASTSKVFDVTANAANYARGSEFITVSVPVAMQGEPADMTVDAVSVPDSVTKYINSGFLANNQLYPDSRISGLTGNSVKVSMSATSNIAYLTFNLRISTLLGTTQTAPGVPTIKLPTIGFKLTNPSRFQVTTTRVSTVFVTLDPNIFRPYLGTPFVIPGTIGTASATFFAAHYDFGGQGVAYNDNNTKDGDGSFRAPDFVDVSGDYSPRTVVGWTSDNEYLTYSVTIEQAGTYEMNMLLGSDNANGRYTVYIDDQALTQSFITVNPGTTGTQGAVFNTGSYGNQKPHLSTVTLPAGKHIFKVFWNRGSHDYRGVIFTRKS